MKHCRTYTYKELIIPSLKREQKLDNIILYYDFLFPFLKVKKKIERLPFVLLKDGYILCMAKLKGLDYENLSDKEKEKLSYFIKIAFEKLDKGFEIESYFINRKSDKLNLKTNNNAPEIINYVQKKKLKYWQEIGSKSYSTELYISILYKQTPRKFKFYEYFSDKKVYTFAIKTLIEGVEILYDGYMAFKSSFERFGIEDMSKEETFDLLYFFINKRKPRIRYDGDISLNAQLADSYYKFNKKDNYLSINNSCKVKAVAIKYYPKKTEPMYLKNLYKFEIPFFIKQSYRFFNYKKFESKMDFNKNIALSIQKVDKAALEYVNEAADFSKKVSSDSESPLYLTLYFYIETDKSYPDLDDNVLKIMTELTEIGFNPQIEKENYKNAIIGMLPGHSRFSGRKKIALSSNAGDLFSAFNLDMGEPEPVDFFIDRNKKIYNFDPFSNKLNAHHMSITGPTGSGKSFFANKMLTSSLVLDPIFYVIDLSESFIELFNLLKEEMPDKTSIMTLSQGKVDFKFNPFLFDNFKLNELTFSNKKVNSEFEEKFNFCLDLITIMCGDTVTDSNKIYIRKSLEEFLYEYNTIVRNTDEPVPPLTLFNSILQQTSPEKSLPNAMSNWLYGRKSDLFNSGIDDFETSKFCYFNLSDLESAQKDEIGAIIFTIFRKISKDFKRKDKLNIRKFLILDEAHKYLDIPQFNKNIVDLIRIGRHYRILVGIITQSINDLINDNNWSTGITTNLQQAVIFNGDPNINKAFKSLGMSDKVINEYYKLKLKEREFLYWNKTDIRRIFRPLTDPFTIWLGTSDPREKYIKNVIYNKIMKKDRIKTLNKCVEIEKQSFDKADKLNLFQSYFDEKIPGVTVEGGY